MPRRDLHIHAYEHGGFAVFAHSQSVFGPGRPPLAAFNTLGEALGFIQKEMAPPRSVPRDQEPPPRREMLPI
ncbi:hypothetical protein E4V01_25165 [Methylorubrum sp. Q1]|uniref:hypothetical protein n=1 Tax=Methylorubrum sp. Q1 TaxID=2562453 RepID=UPI001076ADA0|nr:hypothetical protein [Methylorubrum sp. Q1]TFZ54474.1 hypothetical protein E4V01_25165 [Methylorubrum sp. Q1]